MRLLMRSMVCENGRGKESIEETRQSVAECRYLFQPDAGDGGKLLDSETRDVGALS